MMMNGVTNGGVGGSLTSKRGRIQVIKLLLAASVGRPSKEYFPPIFSVGEKWKESFLRSLVKNNSSLGELRKASTLEEQLLST
jgi:hypothetical protein